ncbi:MAG: hypothetical protein JKP96_10595 [Oceanicaulis sp.]|jgi:hypothetical protein|nr:hypothetical protein [Oceanicaulis sp.]
MGFEYQPTPFAKVSFHERALRWWLREIRVWFEPAEIEIRWGEPHHAPLKGRSVRCLMPEELGFHATLTMPAGEAEQHKRALELKLETLLPLPPDQLNAVMGEAPDQAEESVCYNLVAMRTEDLQFWDKTLGDGGAGPITYALENAPGVSLRSRAGQALYQQTLAIRLGGWALLATSIWLAIASWGGALDRQAEMLSAREANARAELITLRETLTEAQQKTALAERLDYSAVATLRSDLSALTQDLPQTVSVTVVNWSPQSLELTLRDPADPAQNFALTGWGEALLNPDESGTIAYQRQHGEGPQ